MNFTCVYFYIILLQIPTKEKHQHLVGTIEADSLPDVVEVQGTNSCLAEAGVAKPGVFILAVLRKFQVPCYAIPSKLLTWKIQGFVLI